MDANQQLNALIDNAPKPINWRKPTPEEIEVQRHFKVQVKALLCRLPSKSEITYKGIMRQLKEKENKIKRSRNDETNDDNVVHRMGPKITTEKRRRTPNEKKFDDNQGDKSVSEHDMEGRRRNNNNKTLGTTTNNGTKNLKKFSHSLSWALRHAAPKLKLKMTADGFVPVDEILSHNHPKLRGWTKDDIETVVATSDKQRFKLALRPAESYCKPLAPRNADVLDGYDDHGKNSTVTILCIRANQGHSISFIDPNLLLTQIQPYELKAIPIIVHGTYMNAWLNGIEKDGLNRMSRNHIHFASGLPKDKEVISGMKKSCQVYIYINAAKCAEDSIVFYKSDNGVLLTAGKNDEGVLPVSYFSHIVDTSGNILLDQRSS